MDREEFEKRLCSIFCLLNTATTDGILVALLKNDQTALDQYRADQTACEERINFYLTAWDNAPTPEAKMAVVESVTP
jgi:hypothetical protein